MRKLNAGIRHACVAFAAVSCVPAEEVHERPSEPQLIAHRGASAYAPEHTLAAYALAIEQGADFIEPDLQITRDSVLIALHDETLERTTDVRDVYPSRFREYREADSVVRRWHASDFTLDEIKRLDAGSWFGPEFAASRVPTLREVIELARGRVGIYPETKAPEAYSALGLEMERLLLVELGVHGLATRGADAATPVVIQSFSPTSLRVLRDDLGSDLPLTLLLSGYQAREWTTPEGLARVSAFATGIGPSKDLIFEDPELVDRAHQAGLSVAPWTFGSQRPEEYDDVRKEMAYFVCELGVDALFTDNPDLFTRRKACDHEERRDGAGVGRGMTRLGSTETGTAPAHVVDMSVAALHRYGQKTTRSAGGSPAFRAQEHTADVGPSPFGREVPAWQTLTRSTGSAPSGTQKPSVPFRCSRPFPQASTTSVPIPRDARSGRWRGI